MMMNIHTSAGGRRLKGGRGGRVFARGKTVECHGGRCLARLARPALFTRNDGALRGLSGRMCASAKGFGLGTGTQKTAAKVPEGFKKVADGMDGRKSKAVVLGTLNLILFSFEDELYCTEANSTAYK